MQKKKEYLVARAKEQDKEAFTELVYDNMLSLYKAGLAILMNDEDVADAIQDTILSCWEKIHTLEKNEYFSTWLMRIMINHCLKIRNSRKRQTDLEEWEEPSCNDESTLELKEALLSLDEKYRVVVTLYYLEEYSVKEIGEILHMNKSTVTTRLQRGRKQLEEYYGKNS